MNVSNACRPCAACDPHLKRCTSMSAESPVQVAALRDVQPRRALVAILIASLAALALLVVVIYGHGRTADPPAWVAWLPVVNAALNATSAVFLFLAYRNRRTNTPR